jgi:hypothetical protein
MLAVAARCRGCQVVDAARFTLLGEIAIVLDQYFSDLPVLCFEASLTSGLIRYYRSTTLNIYLLLGKQPAGAADAQ